MERKKDGIPSSRKDATDPGQFSSNGGPEFENGGAADASDQEKRQLLAEIDKLKALNALQHEQIEQLRKHTMSHHNGSGDYPTDDEIAAEYKSLFSSLRTWSVKAVRSQSEGFEFVMQEDGHRSWIFERVPLLERGDRTSKQYALLRLVAEVLVTILHRRAFFSGGQDGTMMAARDLELFLYNTPRFADYQRWMRTTMTLVASIDPRALDRIREGTERDVAHTLLGFLEGCCINLILSEDQQKGLQACVAVAVALFQKLQMHPADYTFGFHGGRLTKIGFLGFDTWSNEDVKGAITVDDDCAIKGLVFPHMIKIKNEAGEAIEHLVLVKAQVLVERIETSRPDHCLLVDLR